MTLAEVKDELRQIKSLYKDITFVADYSSTETEDLRKASEEFHRKSKALSAAIKSVSICEKLVEDLKSANLSSEVSKKLRDELLKDIDEYLEETEVKDNLPESMKPVKAWSDAIHTMLSGDTEHAEWIDKNAVSCRCSSCGYRSQVQTGRCPNCGRKMI